MRSDKTTVRKPGYYAVKLHEKLTIAELRDDKSFVSFGGTNSYGEQKFSEISPYPINLEIHLQYKNANNLDFFKEGFLEKEPLGKISERLNYLTNMHAKQAMLIRDLKDENAELQKRISQSQNSNKLLRKELNSIQKKYFQLTKSNETTQHIK